MLNSALRKSGEILEKNFKNVSQWLSLNKLTLTTDKCEIVGFRATTDTPNGLNAFKKIVHAIILEYILINIYILDTVLARLEESFCGHFCGLVHKLGNFLSRKHLIFYEVYAKSIIIFGILIYG